MKTNSKTSNKNVNKKNVVKNSIKKPVQNNIAIAGVKGRGNETRAILKKLGMKDSRNLTFNSDSWYYYVVDGVVKCSISPFINGYETMGINAYYKKFRTSKETILKKYGK